MLYKYLDYEDLYIYICVYELLIIMKEFLCGFIFLTFYMCTHNNSNISQHKKSNKKLIFLYAEERGKRKFVPLY